MPTTGDTKSADQLQLFVRASIPCTLRVLWEISAIYRKARGTSMVDGKPARTTGPALGFRAFLARGSDHGAFP